MTNGAHTAAATVPGRHSRPTRIQETTVSISPTITDAAETAAVLSLQETTAVEIGREGQEQIFSTLSWFLCRSLFTFTELD
ncbi:hypothetical protein [Kitasatospora sp. CB02891]|uniref:hypothetical protein n=1 Tax=Kitasatospora sp. CB02891 TaxID=2020329 RepID=UPI000C278403|nr:hypothetical protein [Kitasatospora sp. CB02891]PJN27846.1 hypothetical protein CG736_06470 [Kitasatospora sp. CB02891]